jgi:nitrous oxidase accessory protein NosD
MGNAGSDKLVRPSNFGVFVHPDNGVLMFGDKAVGMTGCGGSVQRGDGLKSYNPEKSNYSENLPR